MQNTSVPPPDRVDSGALLQVLARVKAGDFTARMPLDWTGVAGKVADDVNEVILANQALEQELARLSRVVGTQGQLSQRGDVGGWGRGWTDGLRSVNTLIDALVRPTTELQRVVGAVAEGDLSTKITIDAEGEFLELKNTVNGMVEHLRTFSGEVTRVAREVGVEGRLGGQARTREVGGVWKDLTDDVNQLAANLTSQVRAIADVVTAVTDGDLSRQVRVEARGEVSALADTLNEMIRHLRETTERCAEQDWLRTNREQFTRALQGHHDVGEVSRTILSELATVVRAQYGVLYTLTASPVEGSEAVLQKTAKYGYEEGPQLATSFALGEGLVGQCAKEKKRILLTEVPEGYVRINSGLGEAPPASIIILPVLFEDDVRAVIELASFWPFEQIHQTFLDSITESVGFALSTIQATGVTHALLTQSQSQAEELIARQEELGGINADLARQAALLAEQYFEAEQKNVEVEASKRLIEEQVSQLAASSTYKSEFIANMSHELRTPLNTVLILAQQLEDNTEGNLSETQVEYASVIHSSGKDLLQLLNSILDLAKVESGTVTAATTEVDLEQMLAVLSRDFEPVAQQRGLTCTVGLAAGGPPTLTTDPQRLHQVLKNLLANAVKFTEHGGVRLQVGLTGASASDPHGAETVTFAVSDTGIGIDEEQQQRIFEAFAQGDGSTSRVYGGTGLGLSISRELVTLLGGTLDVVSAPGEGSTFTVRLPTSPPRRAGESATGPPEPNGVAAGSQPLFSAPAQRPGPHGPKPIDRPVEGLRFLVVDGAPPGHSAVEVLLEQGGGHVTALESTAEATVRLSASPAVDVLLLDADLLVRDGGVVDDLRSTYEGAHRGHLPVIAVGDATAEQRTQCLAAGADAYVPRSAEEPDLLAALETWLPVSREGSAPHRPLSVVVEAPDLHALATIDGSLEGLKVLVVDDEFRNLFAMTAVLERAHAVVRSAESGAQAIDALQEDADVDLVLMDIMMPVLDGYDTMRAIRKMVGLEVLPIVAITGKSTAGERRRCLVAGADDYLSKPVEASQLVAALSAWLPVPQAQAVR